jgi:hypothetical protein
MQTVALLLLLGTAAGLGLLLGWRWWHQRRNNPVHTAVHFILGIAGLECMLLMLRSADGTPPRWAQLAALLLGLAVMAGFAAPVVGRQWGRRPGTVALVLHAALALAGVLLVLAWLLAGGAAR